PGTSFLYFAEQSALSGDSILRLGLDSGPRAPIGQRPRIHHGSGGPHLAPAMANALVPTGPRGAPVGKLAWSPDSRAVLSSISSGTGSQIIAFPIDGSPSYQVYATAMPTGGVAAGGNALAMVTDISRVNLARPVATATAEP